MTITQRAANEIDYGGQQLFPWRVACETDHCQFSGVFYTQSEAEHAMGTHKHPFMRQAGERQTKYMSIAERLWVELDKVVDAIMELTRNGEQPDNLRGRATGLAFSIVHMCQPYYADERAVSIEANKRYKIRNGQLDWEPTPGFKYDPPLPGVAPRGTPTYTQGPSRTGAAKANPVEAGIKRLKAGAIEQIRHALSTTPPMFSKEDLARVYGTTVAVIEAVAKDAK